MNWLARSLEVALAVLLTAMVTLVAANVIGRYVFSAGITWADELARFLFVWLTFLGATLGLIRGGHVGMDIVTARLPPRVRRWFEVLSICLVLLFLGIWGYQGLRIVSMNWNFLSPSLQIPIAYVYLIGPASALMMSLICVHRLWRILSKLYSGQQETC